MGTSTTDVLMSRNPDFDEIYELGYQEGLNSREADIWLELSTKLDEILVRMEGS